MKTNKVLNRQMFELTRELEFFTEKELTMQIGHPKNYWRVSLLKELIDNALDACEVSDIQPEITVEDAKGYFSVDDNGPGLKAETIQKSLNFLTRTSDKQFYVSPTRGQMGNALKTVWAAPFVALGEGEIIIESQGERHVIKVSLDRIAQKPVIERSTTKSPVKKGTKVTIQWPDSPRLEDEENADSYKAPLETGELVTWYSAFNPHAIFHFKGKTYKGTVAGWGKWRTDYPTSAHWYNEFQLRDLIAGYLALERDGAKPKTVREFVTEFRGLAGTAKGKIIIKDFSGVYLHDLMKDNDINMDVVKKLLTAMKANSKPVKSYAMGLVGEKHLRAWADANIKIASKSFKYIKRQGVDADGGGALPYSIEVVFALKEDKKAKRSIITGLNWSPTLGVPAEEISDVIGEVRIADHQPVVLIIHLTKPRFGFVDRGKTRMEL